jgi:hypothetical protein
MKRQDDLREMEAAHVRDIMRVREECAVEARAMEKERVALLAKHNEELRHAETDRINAIRQVDVAAVQQAANVAEVRAAALAATVAASAETLRNQVTDTAAAGTIAFAAALEPIIKDVAELRKVQYEQAGQKVGGGEAKETSAELAKILQPLITQVNVLSSAKDQGTGRKAAFDQGQVLLFALIGIGIGLLGYFVHKA